MSFGEHKWFIEQTSPSTAHMFGIKDFVMSGRTRFQQVEIADTQTYGRCLILDGKIQSAEYDEYIYHEALVQPAMLMHPNPCNILVIGGGEGATIREVFRHSSVEKVTMVDLDEDVVNLCRHHLERWHRGSFDDPRLELIHADARAFLENDITCYDIIISDIPEPVEDGPALRLFTRQFFELVKTRLNAGGLLALQAGDFSIAFLKIHSAIYATVGQVMPGVYSYRAFIPSFNTEWSFILASPEEDFCLAEEIMMDERIGSRNIDLRFFDGETYRSLFAIPLDIRRLRGSGHAVIDDENLLTSY